MYWRDDVVGLGGFDEDYFCYLEDVDLAFRLRLAGRRCLYVPNSVARHVGSATTGRESDFTIYHSHRNLVWTYVKNMPAPLVWLYLPQHVLVNLLAVLWYSLRGQSRPIVVSKRDALRGLGAALRKRRGVQRRRSVPPGELRHVMSHGSGAYRTAFVRARRSLTNSRVRGANVPGS
jgi:GT2 family glycosyltransferase